MKFNIKLNIKAIIRAEQLLSKPFAEIDYNNVDELLKLLYCAVLVNNDVLFMFDEFCELAENENLLSGMIGEMERYNKVLAQFIKNNGEDSAQSAGQTTPRPPYMKELAGTLILSGLAPGYVMKEMELADVPVFLEALEKKKREEMEGARLWTFLTVAPHIDTRQVQTAKDYYPFPWEIEEAEKEAAKAIQRDQEIAERFFNEGLNIFKE